eukprot:1160362-Pelagomonas_calceolata.AAC.7
MQQTNPNFESSDTKRAACGLAASCMCLAGQCGEDADGWGIKRRADGHPPCLVRGTGRGFPGWGDGSGGPA